MKKTTNNLSGRIGSGQSSVGSSPTRSTILKEKQEYQKLKNKLRKLDSKISKLEFQKRYCFSLKTELELKDKIKKLDKERKNVRFKMKLLNIPHRYRKSENS